MKLIMIVALTVLSSCASKAFLAADCIPVQNNGSGPQLSVCHKP